VTDQRDRVTYSLNTLLLLSVSCFWFGCNTAAKELVKERLIFLRECDFNLRVAAYFASKFGVLALIAATQATLFFAFVRIWCQPAGWAPDQRLAPSRQSSFLRELEGNAPELRFCARHDNSERL